MAEIAARLDHAGLAVAVLGAAAAWYCDVFGLVPELTLKVDAIDLSIEMLIHPSFGYRIELLHRPGTGSDGQPANPAEAALRAGYGRPVMPPGPAPEPGVRMAFVADPEGNLIELLHRPRRQP
jgi:lactoylglutathione lyase